MKLSHMGRLVTLMTTVTLALTGCGGAGTTVPQGATTQSRTHQASGKAWMLPEVKGEALIYAVGGCGGTCVLSYPKGKLVGELTGAYGDAGCSDSEGNVFISESTEVVEFAHGGTTPVATYGTPYTPPVGCSVDTESGNLAVVNQGSVAVFPPGSQNPISYNTLLDGHFCGYDNAGNLFVSGYDGANSGLSELAKGTGSFEKLTLDQSVGAPGQVQWDGQYLTYESDNAAQTTISRLSISGSSAEVIGQTRLKKVGRWLEQSWIYKDSVIAPYSNRGAHGNILGIWKYPGGSSIKVVTKFGDYDRKTFSFTGATLSIAP
jgi:hypothetical protein